MATLLDAYNLFHEGNYVLSDMHRNGILVDVPYLERTRDHLTDRIDMVLEQLMEFPEVSEWRKRSGSMWSLDSHQQLANVIYDRMGFVPLDNKRSVNRETMQALKVPFGDLILEFRKYTDARNTFVCGLLREQVDGVVRASIALTLVKTFRSSYSSPNLQNQPHRDDLISRLVRRAFKPRPGHQFSEYDFKGMELCGQASISGDRNMIRYMQGHADGSLDLHWDMAREALLFGNTPYTSKYKKLRYLGKNGFVFPETYGDWWGSIAESMWNASKHLEFNGKPIHEWLALKGIRELGSFNKDEESHSYSTQRGTFYDHMKRVEEHFWREMFPDLLKWRQKCWADYRKTGEFQHVTGFVEHGIYNKNECINHRIQGPGFHVLLKTLTKLSGEIYENGWESTVIPVLQVHDSMLIDHRPELADELDAIVTDIASKQVPKEWSWIKAPLVVEIERAPVGESWYDIKEVA